MRQCFLIPSVGLFVFLLLLLSVGPFVVMIYEMLRKDVLCFVALVSVFLVAFSQVRWLVVVSSCRRVVVGSCGLQYRCCLCFSYRMSLICVRAGVLRAAEEE